MSYGVIITQSGIPLDDAQDYQKVLDSRWKFLDIYKELDIDFTTPAFSTTGTFDYRIYDHNQGRLLPFEFHPSTLSGGNVNVILPAYSAVADSLRADFSGVFARFSFSTGMSTNPIRIKGKLRVYDLDIIKEYQAAPVPLSVPGGSADNQFGALFLDQNRPGRNLASADLTDFTLNTRAKQISIQKTGTARATAPLGLVTITHNVGYPPTYMVASVYEPILNNPAFNLLGNLTSAPAVYVKASASTITLKGVQVSLGTRLFAYIILKDPAEIAA